MSATGITPEISSAVTGKINYRTVLTNRNFILIWGAQITALLGFYVTYSMLFLSIQVITNSSFMVSLMAIMFVIPAIILGVYGGTFSDEHDKRKIMIATNLIRAVLAIAMIPFVASGQGLIALFLMALTFSIVSQFFIPAETSALPRLLPKDELLKANSLFSLTLFGATLTGLSLGSYLYDVAGSRYTMVFASFLLIRAAIAAARLPAMPKTRTGQALREIFKTMIMELVTSARYIRSVPSIKNSILELTVSQVVIGVILVLAPGFIKNVIGLPPQKAWLMIVPAGIGMLIGAIIIGFLAQTKKRRYITVYSLIGIGLATAALSSTRIVADLLNVELGEAAFIAGGGVLQNGFILMLLATLFVMGILISAVFVPSQTTLQEESAEDERGRVFGFLNMTINVAAIMPLVITGKLADIFSPIQVLVGVSVLVVLIGLYQLSHFRR